MRRVLGRPTATAATAAVSGRITTEVRGDRATATALVFADMVHRVLCLRALELELRRLLHLTDMD
jgi:hypothetical protein